MEVTDTEIASRLRQNVSWGLILSLQLAQWLNYIALKIRRRQLASSHVMGYGCESADLLEPPKSRKFSNELKSD